MTWTRNARCLGLGDLYFSDDEGDRTAARKICRLCPVQIECLATAIRNRERNGIWGGVDFEDPVQRTSARAALRDWLAVEAPRVSTRAPGVHGVRAS